MGAARKCFGAGYQERYLRTEETETDMTDIGTVAERLKYREEALVVARDAELEHKWDLAMKIRDDVSINLGWYEIYDSASQVLYKRMNSVESLDRVWGYAVLVIDPVVPTEETTHHVVLLEMKSGKFAILRFERNNRLAYSRYHPFLTYATVLYSSSAGSALSALTYDERQRMQWR